MGGHLTALRTELERLGADPVTGGLPPDLTVVQVGDLVHRGPDSAGVVAFVDDVLTRTPGRWVQLVGNHEAQYLREPAFHWPEQLPEAAALTVFDWWEAGLLHAAVAVDSPDGDWLVTHAGLTAGFWREALAAPRRAADAARALDGLRHGHDDVLFHPGQMLGGGAPDPLAGPVWASAAGELVPSWLAAAADTGEPPPFDQVHGHATLADWQRRRIVADPEVAAATTLDLARCHETTTVGGRRIVGVDPKHGRRARRHWEALVLHDARVHW